MGMKFGLGVAIFVAIYLVFLFAFPQLWLHIFSNLVGGLAILIFPYMFWPWLAIFGIFIFMLLKFNFPEDKFRLIYGILFIACFFIPMAYYHYEGAGNISGMLYPFMLPLGYLFLAGGIVLLLYKRMNLERFIKLPQLLIILAIFPLFLWRLMSVDSDYFLGLWHGVSGDFDTEGAGLLFIHFFIFTSAAVTGITIWLAKKLDKKIWPVAALVALLLVFLVFFQPFMVKVKFKEAVTREELKLFVEKYDLKPGMVGYVSTEGGGGAPYEYTFNDEEIRRDEQHIAHDKPGFKLVAGVSSLSTRCTGIICVLALARDPQVASAVPQIH